MDKWGDFTLSISKWECPAVDKLMRNMAAAETWV
jgi:hypothetical protein